MRLCTMSTLLALLIAPPGAASVAKVFINASDQFGNANACGGNEAEYAADIGERAKSKLVLLGFEIQTSQDFTNPPGMANNWGADSFVSIHTNAFNGRAHGTETLYRSAAGGELAGHVQAALLSSFKLPDRGLVYRDNLYVLNATSMPAVLPELMFHDCTTPLDFPLGTVSESCFLTWPEGRDAAADALTQGICAAWGQTCTAAGPQLHLEEHIDDIAGQDRDFANADGIFDMRVGQETLFRLIVGNAAGAGRAEEVKVSLSIDAPSLVIAEWHVYDNYAGNACGGGWCLNSAETNPANPPHEDPGAAFELALDGISAGESKRIDLLVRGAEVSGQVVPTLRFFVKRVDACYEKPDFDQAPIATGCGDADLKTFIQAAVWPAPGGPSVEPGPGQGGAPLAPPAGDGGSGSPAAPPR